VHFSVAHGESSGTETTTKKEIREPILVNVARSYTGVLSLLTKSDILRDVGKRSVAHVAKELWRIGARQQEEIGLPRESVEPLGALDDTETVATSFVITPFVGLVREPVAWQPDGEETERVIEVPYAALVEEGSFRVEMAVRDGVTRPVYYFDYHGDTIWGATARILVHYLELVRADR